MRRLLFPFELHSRRDLLEARGGVEPRACPPSSRRFGLEDRCRERGPQSEAMVRFELTTCCLRNSRSPIWSYIAKCGRGVRPTRLCKLHAPGSHRSAGMSHAPISWCPRKDSNLHPLVCRTSAPSVELLGREIGGRSWNRTNLSGFSDPR
jgi:hypothetical protein